LGNTVLKKEKKLFPLPPSFRAGAFRKIKVLFHQSKKFSFCFIGLEHEQILTLA
jgi:hypothetical protein